MCLSQQRIGELRFHFKADLAFEHPRAELGVIADLRQVSAQPVVERQIDALGQRRTPYARKL